MAYRIAMAEGIAMANCIAILPWLIENCIAMDDFDAMIVLRWMISMDDGIAMADCIAILPLSLLFW